MTGGYFNHYDDPDEFWDDEPIRPVSQPARQRPDARPADPVPNHQAFLPTESVQGSARLFPGSTHPVATPPEHRSAAAEPLGSDVVADAGAPGLGQLHDLIEEFSRLHAYSAEISKVVQEAFDAGPSEARGHDESGTVDVSLTRNGELTRITVSEGWRARLAPGQLGAAVVSAVRDAHRRLLEFTSITADRIGVIDKLEALDINAVTPTRFPVVEPARDAPSLELGQILELAHKAIDLGQDADPDQFTGSAGAEDELQVSVILGRRDITECLVAMPWGSDVRGGAIATTVRDAYEQAYRQRMASMGHGIESALDSLAGSAIRALTDLQIPPTTHGN